MNVFPIVGYTPRSTVAVDFLIDPRLLITTCEWAPFGDCENTCAAHPGAKIYIYLSNPEFETRSATTEQRGPGGEVAGLIVYYTYSNGKLKFVWSQPYLVNSNAFNTTPIGEQTCRPSFPTQSLGEIVISNFVGNRTTLPPIIVPPGFTAVDLPGRYTPDLRNEQECEFSWVRGLYAVLIPPVLAYPPFIPGIPVGAGVLTPLFATNLPVTQQGLVVVRIASQGRLLNAQGQLVRVYQYALQEGNSYTFISGGQEVAPQDLATYVAFEPVVVYDAGYGWTEVYNRIALIGEGDFRSILFQFEVDGQKLNAQLPLPDPGPQSGQDPDGGFPYVELAIVGFAIVATVLIISSGGLATPVVVVPLGTASPTVVAAATASGAAAGAAGSAASIAAQQATIRTMLGIGANGLRSGASAVIRQTARGF